MLPEKLTSTKLPDEIENGLAVVGRIDSPACCGVSPEAGTFRDYSLSELPPEMRFRLQAHGNNWFSSMEFAESYCFPPAERVCFLEDGSGEIVECCFYRETKSRGFFKSIETSGPANAQGEILRELQTLHSPSVVRVLWVAESDLPHLKGSQRAARAKRMGEDNWIELPKSTAEYLQSLGKKTRKHLPYYLRRLEREWGNEWTFDHRYGPEISREIYDGLLNLNALRMRAKGRMSGWTSELREYRWRLVKERGLLCRLTHRGRLVGGTLSFVHANEAFLIVIAHDPEFDRLNLGSLSLWLTLEHLIRSGHSRYHLMWGPSFYKEQFGGREEPLYELKFFTNSFVDAIWRIADFTLIPETRRLATRIVRKVSWWLSMRKRQGNSDSSEAILSDTAQVRETRG